jgi:hypothetical protein
MDVRTLIAVITYMVGFCGGVGPLQWVWIGELVPPEYKIFSGLIISICKYDPPEYKIFSGLIISICKYELARPTRVQDLLWAHHIHL